VYENLIEVVGTTEDGFKICAKQFIPANTTVLIEAGLCAPEDSAQILMQIIFSKVFMCTLEPRITFRGDWQDLLAYSSEKVYENAYVCKDGQLENGKLAFDKYALMKPAKLPLEARRKSIARFTRSVPHSFVGYQSSFFRGAKNDEEHNTTYSFLQRNSPTAPAFIFFVTTKEVARGAELLVPDRPAWDKSAVKYTHTAQNAIHYAIQAHKSVSAIRQGTLSEDAFTAIEEAQAFAATMPKLSNGNLDFTIEQRRAMTGMANEYAGLSPMGVAVARTPTG
jgi:hypothetical protein